VGGSAARYRTAGAASRPLVRRADSPPPPVHLPAVAPPPVATSVLPTHDDQAWWCPAAWRVFVSRSTAGWHAKGRGGVVVPRWPRPPRVAVTPPNPRLFTPRRMEGARAPPVSTGGQTNGAPPNCTVGASRGGTVRRRARARACGWPACAQTARPATGATDSRGAARGAPREAPPGRGAETGAGHARRPGGSAGDTPAAPPRRRLSGGGGPPRVAHGAVTRDPRRHARTADAQARRGRATPPASQRRGTAAAGRSRVARRGVAPEPFTQGRAENKMGLPPAPPHGAPSLCETAVAAAVKCALLRLCLAFQTVGLHTPRCLRALAGPRPKPELHRH